jgi:hypothetical protein
MGKPRINPRSWKAIAHIAYVLAACSLLPFLTAAARLSLFRHGPSAYNPEVVLRPRIRARRFNSQEPCLVESRIGISVA